MKKIKIKSDNIQKGSGDEPILNKNKKLTKREKDQQNNATDSEIYKFKEYGFMFVLFVCIAFGLYIIGRVGFAWVDLVICDPKLTQSYFDKITSFIAGGLVALSIQSFVKK